MRHSRERRSRHRRVKSHSPVVVGLALVVAGTLWVLHNAGVVYVPIRQWWPLILVAVGLSHLVGGSASSPSPWLLILLGGAFLAVTTGHLAWSDLWRYSPILLIFIGLFVIFGVLRRGRSTSSPPPPSSGKDDLDVLALFGGIDRRVNTDAFRGGRVQAIFGGGEIDLRESTLAEEGAVLEITAIFGGVELTVAHDWPLQIQGNAVFGGVDNKASNPTQTEGPRLLVRATAIMGGVEIKN